MFRELLSLGIAGRKVTGGVEFEGDLITLYSSNLWSRVAGRILVRMGSFRLFSLEKAAERFARYPWELYLSDQTEVRVRVSAHKSRIYHSGALSQRLLTGISRRLGRKIRLAPGRAGSRGPLIFVRMFRDRCQISVDSSGEHLHKRGFKRFTVRAPLRENLAAAMLIASGWDKASPLIDPFCGSGTIIMEAILMSSMIPPGRRRSFAFMRWKNFDPDLWKQLLMRSDRLTIEPASKMVGLDRDAAAVEAALLNLEHAGFLSFADIFHEDISGLQKYCISDTGFIVTNPPYGRRLRENYGLTSTYARFGETIRSRFSHWHAALLCPRDASTLRQALGLSLKSVCCFSNGGIKVDLLSDFRE